MRRRHEPKTMIEKLHAVRTGRLSFTAFAVATAADWARLSTALVRRYEVPDAVEAIDVEQEMLIAAWQACLEWSSGKGTNLDTHVLWRAHTAAKRWMNEQRGAKRRSSKAPSRHPLTFAKLGMDRGCMDDRSSMGRQDDDVATLRLLCTGIEKLSNEDAACVLALLEAGGNVAKAAKSLDTKLRLRLRIGNEIEARSAICRALNRIDANAS